MEELERVIEEAGMNKAAGEDDIPYETIKHLGGKAREIYSTYTTKFGRGRDTQASGEQRSSRPSLMARIPKSQAHTGLYH
jgi:hypothetical protein